MLTLILADSSLELVPKELQNHPSVISYCKRNRKISSEILLDNSWHFGLQVLLLLVMVLGILQL